MDSHGTIYVAGAGDTSQLLRVSPAGTVEGMLGDPTARYIGVTVDRHDNVYAIAGVGQNPYNNIVEKFSPSGQRLSHWVVVGPGNIRPGFQYLAINRQGLIFLSTAEEYDPSIHGVTGHFSVYELTYKGKIRAIWGRHTYWPAQGAFQVPSGIAIDAQGNVYLGDNYLLQKLPWYDT